MLVAKDILFKSQQLSLYLLLLLGQSRVIGAVLSQCLAQHVVGLIDLALIAVQREVVFHRHGGGIVQVGGHHRLATEEGLQVAVLHPEKGVLRSFATKIVLTHHHRTKGQHLTMERGISLIIVSALF